MDEIIPVLLAGGSGTRLWPLSRKSFPKQFSKIIDDQSLFQKSALRLTSTKKIKFQPHITLTNSELRFVVVQQLLDVGINAGPIILEPESKNTAPAILSASMFAYKRNNKSILLVAPSDHLIKDIDKFHDAINIGLEEVKKEKIVTFGIEPTKPETGYGYLQLETKTTTNAVNLLRFIEKPSKEKAKTMIELGNYLWNSGIFLFQAKDMIMAFQKYQPDLFYKIQTSLQKAKPDLGFIRLEETAWASCPDISIDYGIMEKVNNLSVVPFSKDWSDLGDWNAVREQMSPDQDGVSISSNSYAIECNNTLLRSENENQVIVGLGIKDILAIAMPDAVLVAHKDKAQDIKKVVTTLKLKHNYQAEVNPRDYRPWGWFERIAISQNFQVKKIQVNSGSGISLQSHKYRSEHWIIVQGKAKVTIDDEIKIITESQSVYIPVGAIHRLENQEKSPTILIEVQVGSYFGEDDITRYEDFYSRI